MLSEAIHHRSQMLTGTRCSQKPNVALVDKLTNPVSGKACSPTKAGLLLIYIVRLPLPVSQTTGVVMGGTLISNLHLIYIYRIMHVTAHHYSNSMCWGSEGTVKPV